MVDRVLNASLKSALPLTCPNKYKISMGASRRSDGFSGVKKNLKWKVGAFATNCRVSKYSV